MTNNTKTKELKSPRHPYHLDDPRDHASTVEYWDIMWQTRKRKDAHINYMDFQDPEMNEIPGPTIQPRVNVAQLKAQLDALNKQENNALINLMGGGQSQDFPKA